MRSLVLSFVLLAATSVFAAGPAVLATTCEPKSPKDVNLIRVTTAEAKQMLARKTDIALTTSLSAKFTNDDVTLEVDIDRDGNIECFSLIGDHPEDKFTADDKDELRGSLGTGLDFWIFRPHVVNGQPAEVRASYRLHVEPKKLVLERAPILKPKF